MSVLLRTRLRIGSAEADAEALLYRLAEAMDGGWQVYAHDPPLMWSAHPEQGGGVELDLSRAEPDDDVWALELSVFPSVSLNTAGGLVGVAGALLLSAAVGASIYAVVPLSFQLAVPVAILVFLGSSVTLMVAVPVLMHKTRDDSGDKELAERLREVLRAESVQVV